MITNTDVRLARRSDAPWIARLSRDFIEHGLRWRYDRSRILEAIAHPEVNVVVADDGQERSGFGIMEYCRHVAHLVLLGVEPRHQGRGLGRALVNWLEQPALVAGLRRVRVEVRADNPSGLAFYAKLGYHEQSRMRGYYDGRLDALRLDKPLRTATD